jgi:hypothetical protein
MLRRVALPGLFMAGVLAASAQVTSKFVQFFDC